VVPRLRADIRRTESTPTRGLNTSTILEPGWCDTALR
jgi:hypothetical protein